VDTQTQHYLQHLPVAFRAACRAHPGGVLFKRSRARSTERTNLQSRSASLNAITMHSIASPQSCRPSIIQISLGVIQIRHAIFCSPFRERTSVSLFTTGVKW